MNPALSGLRAGLLDRWQRAQARLDRMPPRERLAIGAAALAALVALELMVVLPVRDRRAALVAATAAEHQATQDAAAAEQNRLASEQAALESQLAAADGELRRQGAGSRRSEPLGAWMERALQGQPVQVLALRNLGVIEIEPQPGAPTAPTAPAADATASDPSAQAQAAGAGSANLAMFRHRYELTLTGDVGPLIAAVRSLGERMLPLRIERVRLGARENGSGGGIEATLGFVIISAERTWITL